jgi:hypothetical protein
MKILAFSAMLSEVNLGQDQTVAYNNVITNIGRADDPQTGYFTFLVKDVCMFSASTKLNITKQLLFNCATCSLDLSFNQ